MLANRLGWMVETLTPRFKFAGGGKCCSILLALILGVFLPCFSQEISNGPTDVDPTNVYSLKRDYGRIVDCVPKTRLEACAFTDSPFNPLKLYTSLVGGDNELYYVRSGQTLTLSDLERSFLSVETSPLSTTPHRFNLIGETRFELKYRSDLPPALRPFYFPSTYTLDFPYLAILQNVSYGVLSFPPNNWTVNIDVRTRLCHTVANPSINADCGGITGQEGCADVLGTLQVARDWRNPGTSCSSGACYWFDPPSSYYGQNYRRSWRVGTLSLPFSWNTSETTRTVQTPPSGATIEGLNVSISPEPLYPTRLTASSQIFKALIMMRKRAFPDGMRSLDPLGFPELGENELVFQETNNGVRLQTAVSAWFVGKPDTSFLYRIYDPEGPIYIISDVVDWWASRIFWRSRIPFSFHDGNYGYDILEGLPLGPVGNIFIWDRATYQASILPDYNPNSSTNLLGRQVMEMVFRPSGSTNLVVGRARYEVFFPAGGYRHPPGAVSEPEGLPIPNWFYYYWRAMGSPPVVFTTNNPFPPEFGEAAGFYTQGRSYVYVRPSPANYLERVRPLFARRGGQCGEEGPYLPNKVVYVDQITVRGIHAFATTVWHEMGHMWSYQAGIDGLRGRVGDLGDGDGLLDAWEVANGLCPNTWHTTNAYPNYVRAGIPSDPEVLADVIAYGALMNADYNDRNGDGNPWNDATLWIHDWSNLGLQYGNPLKRFGEAFPWRYHSTGRNISAHQDLLTGW